MGTVSRPDSQVISRSQNIRWVCFTSAAHGSRWTVWLEPVGYCISGEKYYEKRVLYIIYKG
jgi:hypothetical protein